jgi:hypothetical protein
MYRPYVRCMMRDFQPFCPVCARAIDQYFGKLDATLGVDGGVPAGGDGGAAAGDGGAPAVDGGPGRDGGIGCSESWRGDGVCDPCLGDDPDCAAPGDECAGGATCNTCTLKQNCGWCASDGACRFGTDTGPASGTCADWRWVQAICGG